MRDAIEQDDPARVAAAFAAICVSDVHDFVARQAGEAPALDTLRQLRLRAHGRIVVQDPIAPPRRILGTRQRGKESCAERNPREIDKREASPHRAIIAIP